jgi:hypothetical protein
MLVLAVLLAANALASQLSGAIYTSLWDGSAVNKNAYQNKCDVYLVGGPGPHAPASAAGLPEGYYYFQVTDPSGKVLLSTDSIGCRRFHVGSGGFIDAYAPEDCAHEHDAQPDLWRGYGVTIQLCPYLDTPNKGGVYKVWATPVEMYDPPNGSFGFIPAWSKTDNFKVKGGAPPTITVHKFNDANGNHIWDPGEEEISGWPVDATDPAGDSSTKETPATFVVWPGTWTFIEGTLGCDWYPTAQIVDGASLMPLEEDGVTVVVAGTNAKQDSHEVDFGNIQLGTLRVCKHYDRDGDAQVSDDDPVVVGLKVSAVGTTILGTTVELVGYTGGDGCVEFTMEDGYCGLLPGDYTVTEWLPPGTWVNSMGEAAVTSDVSVTSGGLTGVSFLNYCTGTAAFGTKGYWHNKNGLTEMTQDDIDYVNLLLPYSAPSSYFGDGDEPFDGLFTDGTPVAAVNGDWGELIAAAGTAKAEVSHFLVDANASGDPREQLAQQLLAFIFNAIHRLDGVGTVITLPDGSNVAAIDLINQAIDLWASGTGAEQTAMESLLDTLNNSFAVTFIHYDPCPIDYGP